MTQDLVDLIAERTRELHYGSPTSAKAAGKASIRASSTSFAILKDLAANGPSTPDEVAERIGKRPDQTRPRFSSPLLENGWIEDTGLFRTSTALAGEAYVCRITDAGRAIIGGGE